MSAPHRIEFAPSARRDIDCILDWLSMHSVFGAHRWFQEMSLAANQISLSPHAFGRVLDRDALKRDIREKLFGTPKGRVYRMPVSGESIQVLRIRGPGQAAVVGDDLA